MCYENDLESVWFQTPTKISSCCVPGQRIVPGTYGEVTPEAVKEREHSQEQEWAVELGNSTYSKLRATTLRDLCRKVR